MSSSVVSFLNKNGNSQEFLSSGTFVVPNGITHVWLSGCGGGGGGGKLPGGTEAYRGSNGAILYNRLVQVTPGASVSVTIGAGGTGSTGSGTAGGNTTFGSLATFEGASSNYLNVSTTTSLEAILYADSVNSGGGGPREQANGSLGCLRGEASDPNLFVGPRANNGFVPPTASSTSDTANLLRGGTGAFGLGGAGGTGLGAGAAAAANTGAGGGNAQSSGGSAGGNGGSGRLIVFW